MTPASFPARPDVSDEEGNFRSVPVTEEMAPVMEIFFWAPAPTTTTSSSWLSDSSLTSSSVTLLTSRVLVLYPMNDTSIEALLPTRIEKRPSLPEATPVVVPFTTMFAPTIGSLVEASITCPVMTCESFDCWAAAESPPARVLRMLFRSHRSSSRSDNL